jgi:hypothetical protein
MLLLILYKILKRLVIVHEYYYNEQPKKQVLFYVSRLICLLLRFTVLAPIEAQPLTRLLKKSSASPPVFDQASKYKVS